MQANHLLVRAYFLSAILLIVMLFNSTAAALPGTSSETYPPDGATLLMSKDSQVTLRWQLPRGQFSAELWNQGTRQMQTILKQPSWTVSVRPGESYGWILRNHQGIYDQGKFSVAKELSFHADGRSGAPGRSGRFPSRGEAGFSGGQIEAVLRRDSAGMHLYIHTRNQDLHYLFTEPDLRFKISARGGNGGKGSDGYNMGRSYEDAVGRPGGAGGWGGYLKITTYNAPWRQYLDVDLSAGSPGAGGKGGKYYAAYDQVLTAPDGKPGNPGQDGRVETRLGR